MAEYISPYDGCRFDTDFIPREAARCLMYHTQMPLTEKDLMSIPAADVQPVRHGRWEKNDDGIMIWWECSECHLNAWYDGDNLYDYCPNCGCRMDSEEDNER